MGNPQNWPIPSVCCTKCGRSRISQQNYNDAIYMPEILYLTCPHDNTTSILDSLPLITSIWFMILRESICFTSFWYYSPRISNICYIKMVINQNCCRSCRSIIPEGVLFRIQKISISLLICFTCKLAEVTIIAKTDNGRSKAIHAGIWPQTP